MTSLAIRFMSFVDTTAGPLQCWPWSGAVTEHGYGVMHVRGRVTRATHVAMELDERAPASGRHALHECDRPECVNPAHLRWGTPKNNSADRLAHGKSNAGELNGSAKLTQVEVDEIRLLRTQGWLLGDLATRFKVGKSTIHRVVNRKAWS